jgi:hypothetical protein
MQGKFAVVRGDGRNGAAQFVFHLQALAGRLIHAR